MKVTKPNHNHIKMLTRRGLDPKAYVVVKDTCSCVWFFNLKTWQYKIINRDN